MRVIALLLVLLAMIVGDPARDSFGHPVQQTFFAESTAYERFMGRWSRLLVPLLVKSVGMRDGDALLDIGSGTGALAFAAAQTAPSARITGVDPSPSYVAYAQERAPTDRVRFDVGDAQALQMPDVSFDRVVSLLVMNFIPDRPKALREMIRVTRPGGVIAAAVWDYGDGMQMLRVFWDEAVALDPAAAAKDERNMPLCRQGELAALWREHGLTQVDEQPLRSTRRSPLSRITGNRSSAARVRQAPMSRACRRPDATRFVPGFGSDWWEPAPIAQLRFGREPGP